MRILDAVREKVGQSPRLFRTTRARGGRQRLPVDLFSPRVSDVGCRRRILVLGCRGNPVIDRFCGKGVISDQLLSGVWQIWHILIHLKLNAPMLRVLHSRGFLAVPREFPTTLRTEFANREYGRT
jgi:hypothetical protein